MYKFSIFLLTSFFAIFILSNFTIKNGTYPQDDSVRVKSFPAEVSKIIEQKCYSCHNSESRNENAREDLSFDKWDDLNVLQKIGKTNEIHETVSNGEMPPKMFLERFPDRKLTEDEVKTLIDWAEKELN